MCTLTDDFYVIEFADTNVVLGVYWLYSLGRFVMNYQVFFYVIELVDTNVVLGL